MYNAGSVTQCVQCGLWHSVYNAGSVTQCVQCGLCGTVCTMRALWYSKYNAGCDTVCTMRAVTQCVQRGLCDTVCTMQALWHIMHNAGSVTQCVQCGLYDRVNLMYWFNIDLILAQRLWCWPSIFWAEHSINQWSIQFVQCRLSDKQWLVTRSRHWKTHFLISRCSSNQHTADVPNVVSMLGQRGRQWANI